MATSVNDPGLLKQEYSLLNEAHHQLGVLHDELERRLQDLTVRVRTISHNHQGMWIGHGGKAFEQGFDQEFLMLRQTLRDLEHAHTLLPKLVSTVQEADAQASALFKTE